MSKAGTKRKAEEKAAEAPRLVTIDVANILNIDIDEEVDKAVAKVRDGSHSEMQHRAMALEQEKQKQIEAADRHRKMQIKNINQLYEYEVEDAQALYNKAYSELQELLLSELQYERQRVKNIQLQYKGTEGESSGASKALPRHLRSQGPSDDNNDSAVQSTSNGASKETAKEKVKKKAVNSTHPANALDQVLPESSMRSDFLEIVRDLQAQAAAFEESNPQKLDRSAIVSSDYSSFSIGEEMFLVGESISVFSVLSQEHFPGCIVAISDNEIVVNTELGLKISFTISQIKVGRVLISRASEGVHLSNT